MRLGIDASWAGVIGSGTGSYTSGLVAALACNEAVAMHRHHELFLYFRPGDEIRNPLWALTGPTISRRIVRGWKQPDRSLLTLAAAAAWDRLDVFHSPGYFLPLWSGPKVST